MNQKTVTVVVPTYNEQENIPLVYQHLSELFENKLVQYNMEILFIDNHSTDLSRKYIMMLAKKDKRVKAIFNAQNFGFDRSLFYGMTQATGDCVVLMYADMQDPPEMIPEFLAEWEEGYKIVIGVKSRSRENPIMFQARKIYYSLLKKISEIEHIEQYNGFGLYDHLFIEVIKNLDDPLPYFRGIVAELGFERKEIPYIHDKRQYGRSKFNFFKLYDDAMLGITSCSKTLLRISTFVGGGLSLICLTIALITLIRKFLFWDSFSVGMASVIIGVFFLAAVQLFFIGILSEYILNINIRVMRHPLVVEERRINFSPKVESIENIE